MSFVVGGRKSHSPASFLTVDGSFGVVLAVLEV